MTAEATLETAVRLAPPLAFRTLALVMLGGAIGTGLRFVISVMMRSFSGFPWATFTVNAIGSFAFGVIAVAAGDRLGPTALFLLSGVLGGFTTFSSFSWELWALLERGSVGMAAVYAASSLVIGVTAAFLGARAAHSLI